MLDRPDLLMHVTPPGGTCYLAPAVLVDTRASAKDFQNRFDRKELTEWSSASA